MSYIFKLIRGVMQGKRKNAQDSIDGIYNFASYERHIKHGYALLITHESFDDPSLTKRHGTCEDETNLKTMFKNFGFKVETELDKTQAEVVSKLDQVSKADHSKHDCILVIVNTHGHAGGILHAKDKAYSVQDVCKPFLDNPKLEDLPKIFIFQACRGGTQDNGKKYTGDSNYAESDVASISNIVSGNELTYMQSDAAPGLTNILPFDNQPTQPNVLFAYSSVEDYKSFRHSKKGSLYIQEFCSVFQSSDDCNILKFLTIVHRQLAGLSIKVTNEEADIKQACSYVSSFTYKIFLHKRKEINFPNYLQLKNLFKKEK